MVLGNNLGRASFVIDRKQYEVFNYIECAFWIAGCPKGSIKADYADFALIIDSLPFAKVV